MKTQVCHQLARWEALADYLRNIGHHLDPDFEIRVLNGGSANLNYVISMDGQKAVLRRPPDGPLPQGANDVAREYKVLSRLGKAFPPAPKALVYCDDKTVMGVPFCISQFREGVCIGRRLPDTFTDQPEIGSTLSELLVTTLAQLHQVNIDQVGLADLGKVDGFLERQIAGWYQRGSRVLNHTQLQQLSQIRDWLSDNLPVQRLATLVHNDFKLDNMLVDPNHLTVSGVVDWDMCTIGDPIFELAILLAYWGDPKDLEVYQYQCRMPCEAEGWWPRRQVIEHYLKLTGFRISEADLVFYWWLTQYRNAVVYAQLNAQFEHTGVRPTALTEEECNGMSGYVDTLLSHLCQQVGVLPALPQ